VTPGSEVVIAPAAPPWSSATFVADARGVVDLTRIAPKRGDYAGVDAMDFLSARRDIRGAGEAEAWELTAAIDGRLLRQPR
jgi:hypothetical protein